MSNADFQLSLFGDTALDGNANLFWGELEGAEGDAPGALLPAVEPLVIPQTDFRLAGLRGLAQGWKARARDNIEAIKLVATLEREARNATSEEQAQLSRFTGFGAGELANALFPRADEAYRAGWEKLGADLEACTTEAERSALARSTQYAHYTPETVVHAMWDFMMARGFAGGSVLEPGCGTGLFVASRPEKLEGKIAFTGIEMDPLTARIAAKLYPKQWIRAEDFTRAKLSTGYDLAIGNPPFSNRTVSQAEPRDLKGLSLHDWFLARSINALRPNGVAAFVISRHTLDKTDARARTLIHEEAEFLGAVRLPASSMRADAGTDVVVDIVIFRKREIGEMPGDETWLSCVDIEGTNMGDGALRINAWMEAHPEQVLGFHGWASTAFGMDYTCVARDGQDLADALPEALGRIAPALRFLPVADSRIVRPAKETREEGGDLREGSYFMEGGILHQIVGGQGRVVAIRKGEQKEGIFQKHARIIEAMIPVRDATRAVLRAQFENKPFAGLQASLKRAWLNFTRQFGPINHTKTTTRVDAVTGAESESQRRPNLQPFLDDPDVWLVSSIERYDEETDAAEPGPLFTDRVIQAPSEPEIHSVHDALAVCLHEAGRVELPIVAELMGQSEEAVTAELGSSIFLEPSRSSNGRPVWVTSDEYLSGAVRTKLAEAREAAACDARYARNVSALEAVQPEDLRPSDITARLGAPWVPVEVVTAFVSEVIGVEARIYHTAAVACWSIDKRAFAGRAEATSVWGTERRHAGELLEDALTQASPKIFDTYMEDGVEKRVLNAKETEAAKEKLRAIRTAFQDWVWQDSERADRLVRLYNETYNNLVPRLFDGSHLRLPGASSAIILRDHQKRVIWRIIASGRTYMAHAVGAGKTFSMCAAVIEQKRLGLISKAMIVVPGHCLAQMAREFLMLYPTANIMVADETNFVKAKRQSFMAQGARSCIFGLLAERMLNDVLVDDSL